jgi:hypothetical protein
MCALERLGQWKYPFLSEVLHGRIRLFRLFTQRVCSPPKNQHHDPLLKPKVWIMATIHNPVPKGFNPDPSILLVGEDYYIATSTFEWFPGVQIHHSQDLVNWDF